MSPSPTSYMDYAISAKFNSVDAMFRVSQQEKEVEEREAKERFYRTAILYRPDSYSPTYAKWHLYGGAKTGREHLENLTSELKKNTE